MKMTPFTPFLHLIFSEAALPSPNAPVLEQSIATVFPEARDTPFHSAFSEKNANSILGEIGFLDYHIQVAGLSAPLPRAVIDRTIHVSPWPSQVRSSLRQHHAHLSLVSTGAQGNPVGQMLALYAAASGFKSESLLGVVNEPAWTSHPVADFLLPENIRGYRERLPRALWIGTVKFYLDDNAFWLATKGQHLFDVPDFAAFLKNDANERAVREQFANLFYYIYESDAEVLAGDTVEFQAMGQVLRFGEVTELEELLMGPAGTLVIEQVNPDQNQPSS